MEVAGERADRGIGEQVEQGHLAAQSRVQAAMHTGEEQGVSSEVEEVVVEAYLFDPEDVAPDVRDALLQHCLRRVVIDRQGEPSFPEVGERRQVELAAAVEGQRVEGHERRGDHVLGQPLLEVAADLALPRPLSRRDEVGDDPLLPILFAQGCYRRLPHGRMLPQDRLDLAQLDPEAPHLDLVVDAAQEVDVAVGQQAGEIAGAIETLSGRPERIGDELVSRQVGPVQITPPYADPTYMELGGNPHGDGVQEGVQDVGPHVGDRAPDAGPATFRDTGRE
jgi:hypothetical protein